MIPFTAQAPVSWDRPFDVADGFAITLILMLFLVLGGVVLVARGFRRRERHPDPDPWEDLNAEESEDPRPQDNASAFPLNQGRGGGPREAPWEREADWWKRPQDGDK